MWLAGGNSVGGSVWEVPAPVPVPDGICFYSRLSIPSRAPKGIVLAATH